MRFEWDEAQAAKSTSAARRFRGMPRLSFDGDVVTLTDDRFEYGETRYITLGLLRGRTILVVHTDSEDVIRIVSARKATRYEERGYFEHIAD